jgi:hypothetical protein
MVAGRDRRGRADRRPHVRRLVDRGLEGDQRVRHDPEAGSRRGLCRSVLGDADADPGLRHRRAVDRRALRARPALDRQARRGLSQDDRHRRHRLCRPEAEFFMFDDVRFETAIQPAITRSTTSSCRPTPASEYEAATSATARAPRAAISRSRRSTARSTSAARWSRPCSKWACPATSITTKSPPRSTSSGLTFGTLVETADRMQIYKYVVHQVAQAYGKTATFMPKPIKEDNGSGMHTHMSIWEKRQAAVRRQRLCRASATCASISSAASSSTPRRSTPSPTRPPTATSAGAGL